MKETFQRPANYWLRRAEKIKQSGDLIRAGVLQRHALRADPASDAACMGYAFTLRQLCCYEASSREAFHALAQNPARTPLCGLIGQNMLDLGLRQEGLDAMNLYLSNPPDIPPVWQDEAYDRMDECERDELPRRKARLEGLLHIAARRAVTGDLEGANRALHRAGRKPFGQPNARRELIRAMVAEQSGDKAQCVQHVRRALQLRPANAQLAASCASLLWSAGLRREARTALWQSALAAHTPADELTVCLIADQLSAPEAAHAMLRRTLKYSPHRAPACVDMSACLLRMGQLEEALRYAHLAREIDPDDVAIEVFFTRLTRLSEAEPTAEDVRRAAPSFSYYGAMSQAELTDSLAPLMALLTDDASQLAQAITQDDHLRRRFLHAQTLPMDWPAALLSSVAPHLEREPLETLLREVLLQSPRQTLSKRYAASMLASMGVKPPYLTWQDGCLGWIDPTRPPAASPTFRQRVLTMRIRQAARLCPIDSGIVPFCLRIVTHMNAAERRQLINDSLHIWPAALAIYYRHIAGHRPLRLHPPTPLHQQGLAIALDIIERIDSSGGNHP